jgi:hypothetical protein
MPAHDACPCTKYGLILTCFVNGRKRFRPLCFRTVTDAAALRGAGNAVGGGESVGGEKEDRDRVRVGVSRDGSRRS